MSRLQQLTVTLAVATLALLPRIATGQCPDCYYPCGDYCCPVEWNGWCDPPPNSPTGCGALNPGVQFGINAHWNGASLLDKAVQANIKWTRTGVGWRWVETAFGYYNWSTFDQIYALHHARFIINGQLQVLWGVGESPTWMGDTKRPPTTPTELAHFRTFVHEAAVRYPDIRYWEPWNEPNDWNFFHGTVAQYVEVLRALYEEVKAVNPQNKVVAPGLKNNGNPTISPGTFYAQLAGAGGAQYIDIISDHYYGSSGYQDLISWWQERFGVYDRNYLAGKPVWLTETGDCSSQGAYLESMVFLPVYLQRIGLVFVYCLQDGSCKSIVDPNGNPRWGWWALHDIYTMQCRCPCWPYCCWEQRGQEPALPPATPAPNSNP